MLGDSSLFFGDMRRSVLPLAGTPVHDVLLTYVEEWKGVNNILFLGTYVHHLRGTVVKTFRIGTGDILYLHIWDYLFSAVSGEIVTVSGSITCRV